jgi:hypothetical protein
MDRPKNERKVRMPNVVGCVRRALGRVLGEERGDVPGWVLVTAMTVALVLAVWAIASDQITEIVRAAFERARFT